MAMGNLFPLFIYMYLCMSLYFYIYLYMSLFIYMYLYVSVYLYCFLYLFSVFHSGHELWGGLETGHCPDWNEWHLWLLQRQSTQSHYIYALTTETTQNDWYRVIELRFNAFYFSNQKLFSVDNFIHHMKESLQMMMDEVMPDWDIAFKIDFKCCPVIIGRQITTRLTYWPYFVDISEFLSMALHIDMPSPRFQGWLWTWCKSWIWSHWGMFRSQHWAASYKSMISYPMDHLINAHNQSVMRDGYLFITGVFCFKLMSRGQ